MNIRKVLFFTAIAAGLVAIPFLSLGQTATVSQFGDVKDNHPFYDTLLDLREKGLMKGYTDGTAKPDNSVSRAEFFTLVMNATGKSLKADDCFPDVKKDYWGSKYICGAKDLGLTKGYPDGTFKPNNNINIVEASAVMARAFNLAVPATEPGTNWYKPYVMSLQTSSAIPVTIDVPGRKITRSETGEMVLRLKENITNRPTKTYSSLIAPVPNIASCDELKEKVVLYKYQLSKQFTGAEAGGGSDVASIVSAPSAGVKESTKADTGAEGESDYSTTNVQVKGVDEGDIVKNDENYIYTVSRSTVKIVKAVPPSGMEEVAQLKYSEGDFQPTELYLYADTLIVVGSYYSYDAMYSSKTKVYIIDITDRKNPKQVRSIDFDGWKISSRRIGDYLYLVLNNPDYNIPALNENDPGSKIIPKFRDSRLGGKDVPVVGCSKVMFIPRYQAPNFLVVAGINTADVTAPVSKEVVMGASGDMIYSSLDNLYVAATQYDPPEVGIFDVYDLWGLMPITEAKTKLFSFDLGKGSVKYKTEGTVRGTVLNQFSMDEHGTAFRIATTTGNVWDSANPSKNHLFILDKENLETMLGKIENIAPGEKIYSARFIGDRAYLVTFKKVDPFFVIDVADPAAPKILGALKIPGFSDYLHPFDENHIIGFGKDAVDPTELEKAGFNDNSFDFAWYQGMKIALFDVTDVANPKLQFNEVIGDRGTESDLFYDHKALMYDAKRNLFAFPVSVAEIKYKTESDLGNTYGNTVFQGAYVYTVDLQNGFTLKGKITHYEDPNVFEKLGFYWYGDEDSIKRIIYIGDTLYTISTGQIKATNRDSMQGVGNLDLKLPPEPPPPVYDY